MTAALKPAWRERLRDETWTAIDLDHQLGDIIADPISRVGRGSGKRGRIDHSQPPWNAPVAHLVMEMHALARTLEDSLRECLSMGRQPRGGKDENTHYALLAIANLGEAAADDIVADVLRQIQSWNSRALIVLGKRELPTHLPRNVGQREPCCPYCTRFTLRFWSSRGEVRCVNPECRDETERRPVARMEYSVMCHDWVLAWRDGMVGVSDPDVTDERIA